MAHEQFFSELFPRLEAVRRVQTELDRTMAHRFNVLDYLRQNELGLSSIITDFLNPKANHGQGTLFLTLFLKLDKIKNALNCPDLDQRHITVVTERSIAGGRRIDVSVEIVNGDGNAFCLAIENKPYADDEPNQVIDYLTYLKDKYCGRFLLIYLSRNGEGPSEASIARKSLLKWKRHLAIMAYAAGPGMRDDDEIKEMRISHTLADWFKMCRNNCDVDRLRWFFQDADNFCNQTFGGLPMSSDSENETIRDFALKDSRNLETVSAVYQAWPLIRDDVCERFLKHLCEHIRTAVEENESLKRLTRDDVVVNCTYGEGPYQSYIWLYRKSWREYRVESQSLTRSAIGLQNQTVGPCRWGVGVVSPLSREDMQDDDGRRRDALDKAIRSKSPDKGRRTFQWPLWIPLDGRHDDWNSLVPELEKECRGDDNMRDRPITDYFVGELLTIAELAIPVINEVEGT